MSSGYETLELLELLSNWGKWNELCSPVDARKVDGRSTGRMEIWQQVPHPHEKLTQMHGKSTDVDRKFCGRSLFTEDGSSGGCVDAKKVGGISAATWKVDGRSRGRKECWRKLTETPAIAQKVDWRWRKVPRSYGMSTESSKNVQKLTEGPAATRKEFTEGPEDAQKVDGIARRSTIT